MLGRLVFDKGLQRPTQTCRGLYGSLWEKEAQKRAWRERAGRPGLLLTEDRTQGCRLSKEPESQ